MPKCKSCGAEIIFIKTMKRRLMPCLKQPVLCVPSAAGKEFICLEDGKLVKADRCENGTDGGVRGYLPHWGNCPGAKNHKGS